MPIGSTRAKPRRRAAAKPGPIGSAGPEAGRRLVAGPEIAMAAHWPIEFDRRESSMLAGRRTAVVVYRHGGHVVNVFSWNDDGSVRPGAHSVKGFHLLSWKEGGLMLCAVSDTAPQELRTLADLIRKNS